MQDHTNATKTTVGRWGYHAWDERCQPDSVVEYLAGGGGPRPAAEPAGNGKLRMLLLGHRQAIATVEAVEGATRSAGKNCHWVDAAGEHYGAASDRPLMCVLISQVRRWRVLE